MGRTAILQLKMSHGLRTIDFAEVRLVEQETRLRSFCNFAARQNLGAFAIGDARVNHELINRPRGARHMQSDMDPVTLTAAATAVGALAGLAALLRSTRDITLRSCVSAVLNSGALGGGLAMLMFTWFRENAWFLLGLCLLAGLGGMTILSVIVAIVRQGGINLDIKIAKDIDNKDKVDDQTKNSNSRRD